MIVYLVPTGRQRYELYSEAREDVPPSPDPQAGRLQHWLHQASIKWHELVEQARRGGGTGRLAGWRDAVVCRLAENIAEQRTLWGLRSCRAATLQYPANLAEDEARRVMTDVLAHARRHHGRWLIVDLLLSIASGLLALVPGPNLLAYYFLFQLVGHLQSWRGARRALDGIAWTLVPNAGLSELAALVDLPRSARAPRVAAIAARLNLPRLSAFFDRVAVPSA
jgi:K+-H+ exchange-related protein